MQDTIINAIGMITTLIAIIILGVISTIAMLGRERRNIVSITNQDAWFSVKWMKDGNIVGCVENVTERALLHEIGRRFFTSAAMVHRLTDEAKNNSTKSATAKMDYAMKDFGTLDVVVTYSGPTE